MRNLVLLIILFAKVASSQPSIAWNETFGNDPQYTFFLVDAVKDDFSNIIISAERVNNYSMDIDPIVIKYDSNGNLVFSWVNFDSTYSEIFPRITVDSLGDIYLLIHLNVPDITIPDSVKFIKLNAQSGQEIFNYSFANSTYSGIIELDKQYIYVIFGYPMTQLQKYDLQGNQIFSNQLSGFNQIHKMHLFQNNLYVIGDSVVSSFDWKQLIKKYSSNGLFQWSQNTTIANPQYFDSDIDLNENIWITGISQGQFGYLSRLNPFGFEGDTTVGNSQLPVGLSKITFDGLSNIYWLYVQSNNNFPSKIIKLNGGGQIFADIDSAKTNGGDIEFINNTIYVFLTRRGQLNTDYDYEVKSFNSNGNFNWNVIYSNGTITRDEAFKIFVGSNYIYLVGTYTDFSLGITPINIIKLDITTDIKENHIENHNFIYPNPTKGNELNFSNHVNKGTIKLIDLHGRVIYFYPNFTGSTITLPSEMKPGLYIFQIETEEGNLRAKLIKTD